LKPFFVQRNIIEHLEELGYMALSTNDLSSGFFNITAIKSGRVFFVYIRDVTLLDTNETFIGQNAMYNCRLAVLNGTKSFIFILTKRSTYMIIVEDVKTVERMKLATLETMISMNPVELPLEELVENMTQVDTEIKPSS
jgi:hypothetical protein